MKKILTTILFSLLLINIIAQKKLPTETAKDLYWQPDRYIEFSDYQSTNDSNCVKYNQQYGVQTQASIGFRYVVDIPRKRGKIDKGYIVPVFCKNCSCILLEDSLYLNVDRLLFDITEICARNARRDLDNLQKARNIDNPNAMFFTTIKNTWDEIRKEFFGGVITEILIEKQDSAYIKWRKITDEMLETTQKFATTPEDCYRFVNGKPVEKGYKKAKFIVGDMRSKEKIENEE